MTDSKFKLQTKSFSQLRSEFLAGDYNENWTEHNSAMNELYNKLEDIADLIPMLESSNRHCQYIAAYIAAQEGDNATSIFKYIFPLITSESLEVRDEACNCFLSCTVDPAHYLALLNLIKDEEQSIRLRVITILFGLSDEIIAGIYSLTKKVDSLTDIACGMKILLDGYQQSLSQGFIQIENTGENKISVVCSYISAYKHFGETPEFNTTATKFAEADIKKHYQIYFEEESSNSSKKCTAR